MYYNRDVEASFSTLRTGNRKMSEHKPIKIISDKPEKDNVAFGFDAYSKTIAELIANKENQTPLVIGIFGSWGTGNTRQYLLFMICV
jgi:predicted KAP-like P-loop ATPase